MNRGHATCAKLLEVEEHKYQFLFLKTGSHSIVSSMARLYNSRAVIASLSGMGMALILVMSMYPVTTYEASRYEDHPHDGTFFPLRDISVLNVMREPKLRENKDDLELYKRDWESPAVREASEIEKIGEAKYGEMPRRFIPVGIGSFLFAEFGAYRTGPNSFAVVGLGPRHLHLSSWGEPRFECFWISKSPSSNFDHDNSISERETSMTRANEETVIHGTAVNFYLPDKDFGSISQEYLTVVVHCTFENPVGEYGKGGELKMISKQGDKHWNSGLQNVEFVAMVEESGDYINSSIFDEPFQYEYLYCGGPLHGPVSPHRTREWLSYHMRLFGESSHFIFYDAGGFGDEVWKILEAWVKMGRVTIMNVRQQDRYDSYYYNQFLLANDCLFRAKTLAKWTFFFDLDEYIHVTESAHLEHSFHNVMANLSERGRRATSVVLEQRPMSSRHCLRDDQNSTAYQSQWAIENLVYRRLVNRSVWTHWQDTQVAIQAKYVLTMGVHAAVDIQVPVEISQENVITYLNYHYEGCSNCFDDKLHYYHYHGTTVEDGDLCQEFVDPPNTTFEFDGAVYELDKNMSSIAVIARHFELQTLGYLQLN